MERTFADGSSADSEKSSHAPDALLGRIDFTLAQLQYFVAAASTGSVSGAAVQMHASQSTVSSAIQRLERQLRTDLFIRHHAKGIVLTENGRELLGLARAILRSGMDIQDRSRALQEELSGEIDVACFTPFAEVILPPIHQIARERHPGLLINVHEVGSVDAAESVRDGRCELALTFEAGAEQGLRFIALSRLHPYALVSGSDELAQRGKASLAELCERPLVLLDYGDGVGFVRDLLRARQLTPPRIVTTSSFEAMRGLVAAGVGFGIANQPAEARLGRFGNSATRIEVTDPLPSPKIGVALPAYGRTTRRADEVIAICEEAFGVVYGCRPS